MRVYVFKVICSDNLYNTPYAELHRCIAWQECSPPPSLSGTDPLQVVTWSLQLSNQSTGRYWCAIYRKYIDIVIEFRYCFSRFRYLSKHVNYRISKNISINIQSLVCDCAITLEIKVGSVQFSHFKSLSTSFLGLLCNSFSA